MSEVVGGDDNRGVDDVERFSQGKIEWDKEEAQALQGFWASRRGGDDNRESVKVCLACIKQPCPHGDKHLADLGLVPRSRLERAEAELARAHGLLREARDFIATTTPWPGRDQKIARINEVVDLPSPHDRP